MSYDANFDQTRLNQLAEQYLADNRAEGEVFFLSDSDDNRLDHARWLFEEADHDALKNSGFKTHLMELLDTLLVYRAKYDKPNAGQGVVKIRGNDITIEWLPKSEFEELRAV
ncbi:hypothetical protein [Shewanella algae]|uniref:hypothetical protein n=1 Tax=Shewanella algae TaxID=38313 RepID=UPI00313BA8DB